VTRTIRQNRLYWKWLEIISRFIASKTRMHFDSELIHEMLKREILKGGDFNSGELWQKGEKPKRVSTAKLTTKGFNRYLLAVDAWSLDKGLKIETPEERWYNELVRHEMEIQQNKRGVV